MLNTSRRYDVIVIGAGLEGLLCAALLAKRGKQVVVLEEAPTAGGASFRLSKAGYTFIKGPTLFLGFERDGLYDRLFTELGLSLSLLKRESVLFRKTQPPLQIVLPDHRLDCYTEPGELAEELRREFPDQVQELKSLWSEMDRCEEIIRPRMHQAQRTNPSTAREWIKEFQERMRYSSAVRTLRRQRADDFLRPHRLEPEIQRGLELLLLIFNGRTMEEASGLDLIHLLGLLQREMITVSGGIPRLSELLVKVIQEHHGDVVYRQQAAEIILRHRSPDGIRTVDGETVHGTSVILNLPWPSVSVPSAFQREFTLYFGVAGKAVPLPMKEHLLFLHSYQQPSLPDNFLYLQMNSAQEEGAAPKGQRALQVIGYLPETDRPRREVLQTLVQSVTAHLTWLMPFSNGVLTFLGDDLGETEAATRIPIKLAEQVRTTRRVSRDGGSYDLTSLKNLYLIPDLGRRPVAALESARSAVELANLVAKNA
ncbi:MAG: NAD(P)/FAD-dependent oxidoreductase [Nitrospirae bacterium]|nr:NAD(P)/FAD-dependent oxidoreductase [Nitrospirota bacterium]